MAAPTPGSAPVPAGTRLKDGFQCLIVFAADTDVSLFQVGVNPPGVDGGDPINTTTFHNTTYETLEPQQLMTMPEAALTAAYDTSILTQILALVNVHTTVTIIFPDSSSWAFYGYLKSFKPNGMKKGEMPLADVTIQPTNCDSTGAEQAPVFTDTPT